MGRNPALGPGRMSCHVFDSTDFPGINHQDMMTQRYWIEAETEVGPVATAEAKSAVKGSLVADLAEAFGLGSSPITRTILTVKYLTQEPQRAPKKAT